MKQRFQHIILFIILALAWSPAAWGDTWGDNQGWALAQQADQVEIMDGWSSATDKTYSWDGPCETLYFRYKADAKAASGQIKVYVYTDKNCSSGEKLIYTSTLSSSRWGTTGWQQVEQALDKNTYRSIKFKASKYLAKYIGQVRITRATTLSCASTFDMDSVAVGGTKTKDISVDFNNTTYNQNITGTCTNSAFSVETKEVGETGTAAVTITFTAPSTPGKQTGTVTLSMNGAETTFTVSAKATATYRFSATATPNYTSHGSATGTVAKSSIVSSNSSASTTATFTATANSGYVFAGWGTTSSATSYESTANPYKPTISNSSPGSTANKTLYAIFKPVFNFTVTPNKINGSYGSVEANVTNQIVGNPTDTSKSATATFTATPNANCTFEGWYTDAAHTNKVSSAATYTPSITNNTVGSTANLTLYAYFKANQTLEWTNPSVEYIINGAVTEGAAAATAKSAVSGSATGLAVTYSSSAPSVASVNETTGDVEGKSVPSNPDDRIVTITARQAGNDEYNAVELTRQFTVINKLQPTFDDSDFRSSSGNNYTSYVDDTPTITLSNTTSGFTCESSAPTVVSISQSGNVITLKAEKVGTSTVTLNEPGDITHKSASATYHITVTRVPNELAVSLASLTANPDGTIAVTFTDQNNTGTPIVGSITNESLSSGVNQTINNKTPVITYADGVITARNAGTAQITFTQAQTDKYAAWTSSTYDITVTKLGNPISIMLAGGSSTNIKLKYGATASLSYTYANTTGANPTVTRTSSGSYTTYSAGTITAGNAQGTDIYEIHQAESYKYEAGLASFTIRVNDSDEVEGYVYAGWMDGSEFSWSTIGGTDALTVNGPAEKLKFQAKATDILWVWSSDYFYAQYYANGSWTTGLEPNIQSKNQWYDFECDVPENTNQVKIFTETGAVGNKQLRNIRVTRKTYVRESHDTTKDNLGTVLTGNTATSATITVSYSSTNGGNINISSNNSHFVPSISSISVETNKTAQAGDYTYICGVDGTQTFTVTYTPDPNALGAETATITIGDLFYSQTITLTATAAKRANTLAVIGEQTLKVDDVVSDVLSSKNSAATLTATWSRDGVATFGYDEDDETYKITAAGEGTSTLTLTQLENDSHYGVTKTIKVNVSKYDQSLDWGYDLDEAARTLEVGVSPVLTTNTAIGSPTGLAITYSSSNPAALEVDEETGALTAVSGPADVTITATQAGNYKYKSVSITREFHILQREEVMVTTILSTSGINLFPLAGDDITIHTGTDITSDALAITGAEGTLTKTFDIDNNTFTLHAVKEGTVTLTLTRDADGSYYALSKTYEIRVVKPALTLNPTEAPVISHEEYSIVTLNRTLKAGYSTIALPFDTDVETIVGEDYDEDEDWVAQLSAVTHTAVDAGGVNEYTLYFQKTEDGVIEANKPYVLHLANEVVNPTWTDLDDGISVDEASAASIHPSTGYSGYASWTMTSNYTPNFAMTGKYGIVNLQGGLMLGGAGSTLAAFTAYITAPQANQAPRLRVAYLNEDGTTISEGPSFEVDDDNQQPVAIYGPDGKQRARMQRGVNILRYADGTTRKLYY